MVAAGSGAAAGGGLRKRGDAGGVLDGERRSGRFFHGGGADGVDVEAVRPDGEGAEVVVRAPGEGVEAGAGIGEERVLRGSVVRLSWWVW